MFRKIAAVGDCNTLGANDLLGKSYPERIGNMLGAEVINLGHTMATTREGLHLLHDHLEDVDCVFIQFGLVDSYTTFKYSPYVLYYPDNMFRKVLRSAVKKIKKVCRKAGVHSLIGEENVVPLIEYEKNIREMIELALPRMIFVIDTIPNQQQERNSNIRRYNTILDTICKDYDQCRKVSLYELFENKLDEYYQDATHCNQSGCERIAEIIRQQIINQH